MVLRTERGCRGQISRGRRLDKRVCTTAVGIGHWLFAVSVTLVHFANFQQGSAAVTEDSIHLPASQVIQHDEVSRPSHQALSHRALAAESPQLQAEMDSLLCWKQHWLLYSGDNPNVTIFFAGWNGNDASPCGWRGIVCGAANWQGARVTQVNLVRMGLSGPLPQVGYANLSACTSLDFSFNQINGTIPTAIRSMASLQVLDLTMNVLNGGIPPEFEGNFLNRLVSLNLSSNNLSSPIPPTLFSACASLRALNLSANLISGSLPSLGNCSALQLLDLWKNKMNGTLAPELGSLPLLEYVSLAENPIGGPIPPQYFTNCGNLLSLQLARMQLTGPIPDQLGGCSNLQVLNIQSNNITGTIPPSLGQLTELYCLAIGNNSIEGTLPVELSALAKLKFVDFSRNQISGSVPDEYSKLESLVQLALQENLLVGGFPTVLLNLTNLRVLDLSHNQLTGLVPSELSCWTSNMTSLLLAYNNFSGEIPIELGSLPNLQVLDLSFNLLSGSIPPQLGNLKYLLWLQLSYNQLSGRIPPELGNCSSLVWLNLCHNRLTGPIPDTFDRIGQGAAHTFLLNQNTLPFVPAEMGECGAMERWLPGSYEPYSFLVDELARQGTVCRKQWNLLLIGHLHPAELDSPLAYLQLSYNKLSGPIPRSLGDGSKLSILYFDKNELTGPIPDTLGSIPLFSVNFSSNRINGTIPATLGMAQHLLSLDLSFNDLTGPLPASLGSLTFMDRFNVSYNNLSAPIPSANQFATYSISAYAGNPYLCSNGNPYASITSNKTCGEAILQDCGSLHHSSTPNRPNGVKAKRLDPKLILGIALGCTAVVLFAAGLICLATSPARREGARGAWKQQATSIGSAMCATDSGFRKVGRDYRYHSDSLTIPVSAFGPDGGLPKALAYGDLLEATDSFADANIIGDGGFGVVYRAKLSDGSVVAIKKLIQDGAQGEREFAAEMLTLGNIRHENLVPLLGYCASANERLLVYKCMINGSLEEWLHARAGGKEALGWGKRVNIAAGAARGVAFLHHYCAPVIIHRDMKASNILLDDSLCACVTDFGLARRMYGQDTHVSTIVAGTLGYVPPEYSQTWRSTTRGDVYSFGVVLLELVTGRRPTGAEFDNEDGGYLGGSMVEWVRILLATGRHEEAYDPIVKGEGAAAASKELLQFLKLAVACTEETAGNRPAMKDVSKALDQIQLSISSRSPSQAL